MRTTLLFLLVAAAALADSVSTNKPADTATGYIEKFEVPQRDEAGNLKWKLGGDRATFRPDGLMNIINVRGELYTSNQVDMVFTAPIAVLDRANNRAATDAPVRIERASMILTGIGGDWDGNQGSFIIRSNVQVILKSGGLFSPEANTP
jgi:lipopolysaccharide export system protein LptC